MSAKIVSEYLSVTAVSMLVSSYLGGKALDDVGIRGVFLCSSIFPIVTIIAAAAV